MLAIVSIDALIHTVFFHACPLRLGKKLSRLRLASVLLNASQRTRTRSHFGRPWSTRESLGTAPSPSWSVGAIQRIRTSAGAASQQCTYGPCSSTSARGVNTTTRCSASARVYATRPPNRTRETRAIRHSAEEASTKPEKPPRKLLRDGEGVEKEGVERGDGCRCARRGAAPWEEVPLRARGGK